MSAQATEADPSWQHFSLSHLFKGLSIATLTKGSPREKNCEKGDMVPTWGVNPSSLFLGYIYQVPKTQES